MEQTKATVLNSFKDLMIEGPAYQLDLEEDAWAYGAPPPPAVYTFKWFLDKDGITIRHEKEDDPNSPEYARISIIGRLQENEEWNETPCYTNLDSRVFKGKAISTLAGFIVKAGAKKYLEGKRPTLKELGTLFDRVIKSEPTVSVEVDWRGSYMWTDPKGVDKWENCCKHWADFPENKEVPGERVHSFTITGKDGQSHDVRAQIQVVRFLSKLEAKDWKPKLVSGPRTGGNAPLAQRVVVPELAVPVPVVVPAARVNAPVVVKANQVEQDDLDLMLQD